MAVRLGPDGGGPPTVRQALADRRFRVGRCVGCGGGVAMLGGHRLVGGDRVEAAGRVTADALAGRSSC